MLRIRALTLLATLFASFNLVAILVWLAGEWWFEQVGAALLVLALLITLAAAQHWQTGNTKKSRA